MRPLRLQLRALFLLCLAVGAGVAMRVVVFADTPPGDPPAAAAEEKQPVSSPTTPAPEAKTPPAAKAETEPTPEVLEQWKKQVAAWKEVDPREAADNSFCYVCHANYENEKLVSIHEPEGVGCETCHGMSVKHSQDEDSLEPADILFAPAKVTSYCVRCHEKRDLLEGDEAHEKFFAGESEPEKTCTGCHDMKHKLKVRTRRWDKDTREDRVV